MLIVASEITGLVLAGGQGSRMGGVDKGLQLFNGHPLAQHALERLRPQVGRCLISANRHLDTYAGFGAPVLPDTVTGYAGPLAGVLAGLERCETPWLVTVPCDSPRFPADLVARLAEAAARDDAEIAMVTSPDDDGVLRRQPVFCLLRASLRDSLARFLAAEGRKIGAWTGEHHTVLVPFDRPGDDKTAFANTNTVEDLQRLQGH